MRARRQQPDGATGPTPSLRLPILIAVGALVLALAAIVTVVALANRAGSVASAPATGPIALPAAPAPGAEGKYCAVVMQALPDRLGSAQRRALSDPQPGVAAWGDPPLVLRCGIPDPEELTCSAQLAQFTGPQGGSVAWLRLSDPSAVTYIAVDRPVRIAITLPPGTSVDAVLQLTELIAADLPTRPVCTSGTVTPPDNG